MRTRIPQISAMFGVVVLVLILDQLAKAWITANMVAGDTRPVIDEWVRLRYTQNSGAAFGFFQGWTGGLSIVAIVIIGAIIISAQRVSNGSKLMMLALGLVLGGAFGNLVDRLRLGYVVDFIEVYGPRINFNNRVYIWPVFNLADSAITIGVALIVVILLFGKQEARQTPELVERET